MKQILLISLMFVVSAHAEPKTFNVDDPPFYTMTFEEISRFNNANPEDKDVLKMRKAYFDSLFIRISRLKSSSSHPMEKIASEKELERLSYSDERWNKFRAEVFYACEERNENAGCKDLLAYRMNVFNGLSPLHHAR